MNQEGRELSAAERMQAFRSDQRVSSSGLEEYFGELSFDPDPFQREALTSVALEHSVLVCAPTGAGKTMVGEGAVYLALREGARAFYTTPIKALSNQKYREFCARFGEDEVGLLTGDTAINPRASVVVMTTEVLRNMIYAEADLSRLRVVVLDEIHYLADRVRGPVWEEVLIQLPEHIQVVALSATVSNSDEFGRWIAEVRGTCDVVVDLKRPVPLYQHMLVGHHLYGLYSTREDPDPAALTPPRINPDLLRSVENRERPRPEGIRAIPKRVNRPRVLEALDDANLLPAIVFIFSRAGCDEAVRTIVGSGVTLTTAEEQRLIRAEVESTLLAIPVADHGILGLAEWQTGLERGVAAHHAGLLPLLKETVERLFSAGLVKLVYATETLALGINMPARTVVLESLEKWNGSEHVRLTPGEYTQLTGRAGRRGIDIEGHAVVLHRGVVAPEEMAQLASRHSYPLRSAFYPGYNMVVNLLHHSTLPAARQVLESSFAQFQADNSVVQLAASLRRSENQLQNLHTGVRCSRGDAPEYFQLREDLSQVQRRLSQESRAGNAEQALKTFQKLRPGQVVVYRRGRRWYTAAILVGSDRSWNVPGIRVLGEDAKVFTVAPHEVNRGPSVVGQIRLPAGGVRRPRDRQAVAKQVRAIGKSAPRPRVADNPRVRELEQAAADLERRIHEHPVHACPDRDAHAQAGHEWVRLKRETARLAAQINARTSTIAAEFDRVCQVLQNLDYLREGSVTDRGSQLRKVFGERDLLVAECVAAGVLGGLEPGELAAIASALVYEPRGDASAAVADLPTPAIAEAWMRVRRAHARIAKEEAMVSIDRTSAPAPDLIGITYRWAGGSTLSGVLGDSEMTGGDFVRWMRQTIDLLEQLRRVEDTGLQDRVRHAAQLLRRGVVAWAD